MATQDAEIEGADPGFSKAQLEAIAGVVRGVLNETREERGRRIPSEEGSSEEATGSLGRNPPGEQGGVALYCVARAGGRADAPRSGRGRSTGLVAGEGDAAGIQVSV